MRQLWRFKAGFDPEEHEFDAPGWCADMDFLLTTTFKIKPHPYSPPIWVCTDEQPWDWVLDKSWIEPASIKIDLSVLGEDV